MLYRFFAISILLLRWVDSSAQAYPFRHYQVEQGLSNNTVFCTVQDRHGFIWMGTKDGLNRFDGHIFKVFRHDPDDSLGLGDSFIRSLHIGRNHTLYAGTRNGLYAFDERLERFSRLFTPPDEIREMAEDAKGRLWLVAGPVLYRISLQAKGKEPEVVSFRNYSFTSVATGKEEGVWAATAQGEILRYQESPNQFLPFKLLSPAEHSLPLWIEKITLLPNGTILAGTANYGALQFDPSNGRVKPIISSQPGESGIFVRDFLALNDSTLWLATENGIYICDTRKGTDIHIEKDSRNPYALSDNAVYCLYSDREGGIWAGTYFGGINYFPRQYAAFHKTLPGNGQGMLQGQAVREIVQDREGNLWLGTEDGGLNRLEKQTGNIHHYPSTGRPGDIAYPNIHGLLVDGENLWVGTFEHGLDLLNTRTGQVVKHYPLVRDTALKSNFFVVLSRLRNGDMLAGTRHGLYRFMPNEQVFEPEPRVPSQSFVHTLLEDQSGNIWVGTLGNGLFRLAPGKPPRHYLQSPNDKNSLPVNAVTTLFQGTDSSIWVGTEGGGLCRYIPGKDHFVRYSLKEGFPSNTIFKILEDEARHLWITTSRGLVVFDHRKDSLKVYTTEHGLLSNQFNYNSGYRDREGVLYFGSARGMISFDPKTFRESNFVPQVHITGLSIGGRELVPGGAEGVLTHSLLHTKRVELSYDQASFSLDFAALSFTAPERTEYQYIMEGLDREWTYLKTNRKVYFTNLRPGTYTFRVKGTNSSGKWSGQEASLEVIIHPPYWASPLAYTLYTLLGALIAWLLFRNYHQAMNSRAARKLERMRHEKEEEMYRAKIEFFTNVAHEIKTPLTLIKAPMEQIMKKGLAEGPLAFELKVMERNTDRLLELTQQLLDFRKVEAAEFRINPVPVVLQEMLKDRYQRFRSLAVQRKVKFTLELPDMPVEVMADWDAVQKIADNLLSNALSYCHRQVKVTLESSEPVGLVRILMFNDGPGIPENMKEQVFKPFFRLAGPRNKTGAGIGLALARSLAQLHGGDIKVLEPGPGGTLLEWTIRSLPPTQT